MTKDEHLENTEDALSRQQTTYRMVECLVFNRLPECPPNKTTILASQARSLRGAGNYLCNVICLHKCLE